MQCDIIYDLFRYLTKPLSDTVYLKIAYRIKKKKPLNLDNPITLDEKIQWLKLHNRSKLLNTFVDKITAKKLVSDIIGDEYIIPTIGVWDSFDQIDFDVLPNQFVLKCNHDSHSVIICKDKTTFDFRKARKTLEHGLKTNYYWHGREWVYKDIKPRILAERYINDDSTNDELTDYKFYCFGDYVDSVLVCQKRSSGKPQFYFFDKEWNLKRYNKMGKCAPQNFTIEKPENLNQMFEIAAKLSKNSGAPFVRVDLYNVRGRPYFGEMTYAPCNGMDTGRLYETDLYFGSLIHLEGMDK